jgi:hypothetical protein
MRLVDLSTTILREDELLSSASSSTPSNTAASASQEDVHFIDVDPIKTAKHAPTLGCQSISPSLDQAVGFMEPDTFPDWFNEPVFLDGHDKRQRRDTGYNVSSTGSHHDDFVPSSTTTYRPVGHDVMWNYGETNHSYPTATDSTITSWIRHLNTPTTQPINGTPSSYDSGSFQAGFEATVTGDERYNSLAALDAQSGEYQVGRLDTDKVQCDRLSPSDSLHCYGMVSSNTHAQISMANLLMPTSCRKSRYYPTEPAYLQ